MRYHVTHQTTFTYKETVSQCLNEVRLTPRSTPWQTVHSSAIRVTPAPLFLRRRTDYFGNEVATFGVFDQHQQLTAIAESDVEVRVPAQEETESPRWEDAVAAMAVGAVYDRAISEGADPECLLASEFVHPSPYVPLLDSLSSFAAKSFSAGTPLVDAVLDLTHRIHEEFRYAPEATSVDVPLSEVVTKRHGVCQDFAHVMIGALRSHRLAARYVSGYVRSGPEFQGSQASHAWVSVYVPGSGWLSFDPTNCMMPSDTHIALAWGRDYGDVAPVKGVTLGGGGQVVEVKVFVKAEEEA